MLHWPLVCTRCQWNLRSLRYHPAFINHQLCLLYIVYKLKYTNEIDSILGKVIPVKKLLHGLIGRYKNCAAGTGVQCRYIHMNIKLQVPFAGFQFPTLDYFLSIVPDALFTRQLDNSYAY